MNYQNLFDKNISLMRGRKADGSFVTPFNPLKWGDAFTEGNSWHYTWAVFHDPQGLINLMGGKDKFNHMMDSVFVQAPSFDDSYYGGVIHEIREMQLINFGQYAHGNQPIQHMGTGGGNLASPTSSLVTLKHFLAYGIPQGGQNGNPSVVGRRDLLQNFLPPFETAINAGALSVMTSYNSVDGVP